MYVLKPKTLRAAAVGAAGAAEGPRDPRARGVPGASARSDHLPRLRDARRKVRTSHGAALSFWQEMPAMAARLLCVSLSNASR